MNRPSSSSCQKYVFTIGCIGMLPVVWALWGVFKSPPHAAWYLLAGLALLNGPLSIRLPSMRATISVSEGVFFTSTLLFGPAASTMIAAIDGLAVSLWSRNRSAMQTLFGVAEPAISVSVASLLFYYLAGEPPLLHRVASFAPLLLPILALTVTYFALNTVVAGTAVWLEVGGAPLSLLRRHLPSLTLDFCVSLSIAGAVIQTSGSPAVAGLVVLSPMLLAGYISSRHTAGRLEDTNRHLAELRRLYDSTIETLAMAVDAKDQVTHGHIRRVQLLSTRLARALGASDVDLQALAAAALLHDLGKLAVPEHILNKPGPLTPAEYEEMKKHAPLGASILSGIAFPFPVVPLVRHHHENWDGTGYPDRLKGDDIPLGARILAVVDCYDALTSDRPYRRRMTHDQAMAIIWDRTGRLYDPTVVQAFMRIPTATETGGDDDLLDSSAPLRLRTPGASIGSVASGHGPTSSAPLPLSGPAAQLIRALSDCTWGDAGRAVASLTPTAIPDSVAVLFRFDHDRNQLVIAGMNDSMDGRIPETIAIGRGVTGWVAANRQSMFNSDAELDLGESARLTRPPLRLCISTPVLDGARSLLGVLTVYSPYAFTETDRLIAESCAAALTGVSQGAGTHSPCLRPRFNSSKEEGQARLVPELEIGSAWSRRPA